MADLSKTAANKRVRQLEKTLYAISRAYTRASQRAIDKISIQAVRGEVSGERLVGAMQFALFVDQKFIKFLEQEADNRGIIADTLHNHFGLYTGLSYYAEEELKH